MSNLVLDDNLKLLQFTGFLMNGREIKDYIFYLRYALLRYMIAFGAYNLFICHPMYIYNHTQDFAVVSETIMNMLTSVMMTTNCLTIFLQNEKLYELVAVMRKIYEFHNVRDSFANEKLERTKRICDLISRRVPRFLCGPCSLIVFIAFIDMLIARDLDVRTKCWYPVNQRDTVALMVISTLFMINFVPILVHILATDTLLVCLFLHALAQLKVLDHKIRNMKEKHRRKNVSKSCVKLTILDYCKRDARLAYDRDKELDMILDEFSRDGDESSLNGADLYIKKRIVGGANVAKAYAGHRFPLHRPVKEKVGASPLNSNFQRFLFPRRKEEVNSRPKYDYRECVDHHAEMLKFVKLLGDFWNPVFTVKVVINLCSGVLLLVSSAMKAGQSSVIMNIGIVLIFLLEFALFCYFSERVKDATDRLSLAIFECDWIDSSINFKKSILMMMSMANKPIVLRAAGFVPLSLDTFVKVLKSAYSTYMVLKRIQKG